MSHRDTPDLAFLTTLEEGLRARGATDHGAHGPNPEGASWHRWELATPLGPLYLHPEDRYVQMQFGRVAWARAGLTVRRDCLNPHTGRWNYYFPGSAPGAVEAQKVLELLDTVLLVVVGTNAPLEA